jgi:outer membrane receptor for ferrienterochelin and colicins
MSRIGWLASGIAVWLCVLVAPVAAQQVRGTVLDATAGVPVSSVRVELEGAGVWRVTTTGWHGGFTFGGVPSGAYRLRFTRVGYAPRVVADVPATSGRDSIVVRLLALGTPLDPVIVSASRSEETALDAPTAATVVGRREIEEAPTVSPLQHVEQVPGVNAAEKGLIQQTFSARGVSTVNSGALLLLQDYRYAALPSYAFNVPYMIPATNEDIDRIEVISGPASALYGPGAPSGVVQVLTRSPLDAPGGAVTLTGGTRSVLGGSFRYAAVLGHTLGVKLSGELLRGHDWPYTDPIETKNRADSIAAGADSATLRVARRDSTVERLAGDLRVDWRPDVRTDVVLSGGIVDAVHAIDLTPAFGAVQGEDWRNGYVQLRGRRDRLFANVVYDWQNAGNTYFLQTGAPVVDSSRVLVTQVQHGTSLGGVDLLYGVDGRWTDPRTGGKIDGANEANDQVAELGAYLSAEAPVGERLRLIGALRVDHHNRLNDVVLSPRAAIVFKPSPTQALRLTYNRAFTSPDANDLFLDLPVGQFPILDGVGYTVRGVGVPKDGFTFRHDCNGGLCMRSPFYQFGMADLPADVTLLWPLAVVAADTLYHVDLSGIPAPTAADIGTRLALLDINSQAFVPIDPSDVTDIEGEGRTITNVVELGYKGQVTPRLAAGVSVWVNRVRDVAGPYVTATPNAFLDRDMLYNYLVPYVGADTAALLADTLSKIPAGTVSPTESLHPTDILLVNKRGGAYTLWGSDVELRFTLSDRFAVSASYSWTSNDTLPDVQPVGTVYLNAPRNKGTFALTYREERLGLTAAVRGRMVAAFTMNNGISYTGRVASYGVVDATVGLQLPGALGAGLTVTVQNVFDNQHQEMVGAPPIGRLLLTRLRAGF